MAFDLQGHRGARGLRPENTLPAFAAALDIGVTTLELDVGVTADGGVVVSHNLELSPDLTRAPDGAWLTAPGPTLRSLPLAALERFDVGRMRPGSRYAARFPEQRAADGARIPTLEAVITLTRRVGNDRVRFNVETKLDPNRPNATLQPRAFARAVLEVLRRNRVAGRATLQSFDWRTLRYAQSAAPSLRTAYLTARQRWLDNLRAGAAGPSPWTAGLDIDDFAGSVPRLVKAAGGNAWSPYYREIDRRQLDEAHALGLSVVVWTVNDPAEMRALIALGVDGIITDYPDRLRAVCVTFGIPVPAAADATPAPARR